MVALANQSIFVLAADAECATELVRVLQDAGADIVIAANVVEALQRLEQFRFDGGVIDGSPNAEKVADRLKVLGVPFCVCGGAPSATREPETVIGTNRVVAVLGSLLNR
jgi:hypothetical protein